MKASPEHRKEVLVALDKERADYQKEQKERRSKSLLPIL
jgi:hypothetical protein